MRRTNHKMSIPALALTLALLMGSVSSVGLQVRAEDSLEDLKRQKTEARDRVDDARSKLDQAAESKQGLERELDLLSDRIKTTRQTMDENNRKISGLQEELGQAQADKSGRLAAMKLRIRYMYEQGSSNDLLVLFFTSENFADFLAKFDYAAQLTRYEQKMIGEMEKLQEEIDAKAADLSSRQDALQEEQETLLGQQDEMNRLLASASDEVRMKYMDYSGARDRLKQIDQSIADMQAALMAEQKRNEARKLAEADRIARQAEAVGQKADQKADPGREKGKDGSASKNGSSAASDWKTTHAQGQAGTDYWVKPMGYSQQELEELTTIIFCEAGGEGYKVQLGVGSVILNRVRSPYFPGTIHRVIFAPGQFEPTWIKLAGRWDNQVMFDYFHGQREPLLKNSRAYQTCRQAALDVLNGKRNTNLCFFWAVSNSKPAGSIIMGRTVFFGRVIQNS